MSPLNPLFRSLLKDLRRAQADAAPPLSDARRQAGFTLLELLVVMAILALLAGLVAPRVIGYLGTSKTKTAKLQIDNFVTSLRLFNLDTGTYPNSSDGLTPLAKNNGRYRNWSGPYLTGGKLPADPWGNPFRYRYPGQHGEFDIFSLGADNQAGGTGENQDVTSW